MKGKNYRLSDNSKLTGVDFAYNSKLASKIYVQMKMLQKDSCKTDTYSRFSKVLYLAVRNDQVHELGKLQLGYGDVTPLKGFRFSKKTSWQTFFMNRPTAAFDIEKGAIHVAIPHIFAREFNRFPERTSKVILKMHCIQVSLDDENSVDASSSKELVITNKDEINSRSVYFSIKDRPNVMALCVATVRIWLVSTDGQEEFLSQKSSCMTAEIFDALLIRDGQLRHFEEQKSPDITPPASPDSDEEIDWV